MRAKEKKEINVLVGQNIRFYREKNGYTREQLSELIEVSTHFLYDVERGNAGISLTTLKKICEVLCVSADNILWKNIDKIDLNEHFYNIDPKYHQQLEKIIHSCLEIISISSEEE